MAFSSEERALITSYARLHSTFHYSGFLFATLAPIFAFAVYGWIRYDIIALTLAFMGLAGFMLWYLVRARQSTRILTAICRKIETAEAAKTAATSI